MNTRSLNTILLYALLATNSTACAIDPNTESLDESMVDSTIQAVTVDDLIVTCSMDSDCRFDIVALTYRARFSVPGGQPQRINSWVFPRNSVRISGCGSGDSFCELDLKQPSCISNNPGLNIISVQNEQFTTRPFAPSTLWTGIITIPSTACTISACTAPPTAAPALTISSYFCHGMHDRVWTAVPGAAFYQGQAKPMVDYALGIAPTTPWSYIPSGYLYPGIVIDTSDTECFGNSSSSYYLRVRACNECGCGPWSFPDYFEYWSLDCA